MKRFFNRLSCLFLRYGSISLAICGIYVYITNHSVPQKVMASEISGETVQKDMYVNLKKTYSNFEEGFVEIPQEFQQELLLYTWIAEAVEQYMAENGIEEEFYCDMDSGLLYGSREFKVTERGKESRYEYSIQAENTPEFERDIYKLKLEGKESILYAEVCISEEKVYLYQGDGTVIVDYESGDPAAYELIKRDENNQITYYPDYYVEAEWDDMKSCDNHFTEVSAAELASLKYLQIPKDMGYMTDVYLNVASVLKRYVEENEIEDVFYFNAEEDVISNVTNMIYTCRLKGREQTLYMDIDAFHMKCHVYQVEK